MVRLKSLRPNYYLPNNFHLFSVFPVERDVKQPGYVAIFIKPNPFKVNNTAFYQTQITTRRPWASTIDLELMKQANNKKDVYDELLNEKFWKNKKKVRQEVVRRERINEQFEEQRRRQDQSVKQTKPWVREWRSGD